MVSKKENILIDGLNAVQRITPDIDQRAVAMLHNLFDKTEKLLNPSTFRKDLMAMLGIRQVPHLEKKLNFIKDSNELSVQFHRELNRFWILSNLNKAAREKVITMGQQLDCGYKPGIVDSVETFNELAQKTKASPKTLMVAREVLVSGKPLNKVAEGVQMQQADQVCKTICGIMTNGMELTKLNLLTELIEDHGEEVIKAVVSVYDKLEKQVLENGIYMHLYAFSLLSNSKKEEFVKLFNKKKEIYESLSDDASKITQKVMQSFHTKMVKQDSMWSPALLADPNVEAKIREVSANVLNFFYLGRLLNLTASTMSGLQAESEEEFEENTKYFKRLGVSEKSFLDDTVLVKVFNDVKDLISDPTVSNQNVRDRIERFKGTKRGDFTRLYLVFLRAEFEKSSLRTICNNIHPEKDYSSVFKLYHRRKKDIAAIKEDILKSTLKRSAKA